MFVSRRNPFQFLGLILGLLLLTPAVQLARAVPGDDVYLCDHSMADPDAGIAACTRLIGREPNGPDTPGWYDNRGLAKLLKNDITAINDFTSALDLNPRFVAAFKNRGRARMTQGDYGGAIADYTQAIRLDGRSADLYNERGLAFFYQEQFGLAILDFNKAITLDNTFANAFYNRGQANFLKKQFNDAIADFGQFIKLASNDPKGYIQSGDVRIQKADFDGAIRDYNEAIGLDPRNWEAYSHRGEARRLQGDLDGAFADHNKAIDLSPDAAEAYVNRALTWGDKGKFGEAITDCEKAIFLKPGYDLAYANRGKFRRLTGDLGPSLTDLNKALNLDKRSHVALTFRGDTFRELGDLDHAMADFNNALDVRPDFVAAYTGRGLTYEKKGDKAKAIEDFEKALSLPSDIDAGLARPAQDVAQTHRDKLTTPVGKDIRVALVIGNSSYVPALPKSEQDTKAVAPALRKVGFQTVLVGTNLTRDQFLDELSRFHDEVEKQTADWAVIFYEGHGFEVDGVNYLIPVDANLRADVEGVAVSLDRVLLAVKGAKNRVVILDACRDMHLTGASRPIGRGCVAVKPERGTLVAFAAKAGQIAEDGDPFTQAFLKNVDKPQLDINMLFQQVHDEVLITTGWRQEPSTYGSLGANIYLRPK